jgi:HK97 family phage major capsid protein
MKYVAPDALHGAFILKDSGTDDPAAVVQQALDDLRTSIDGRLKAVETKGADAALTARLDQLEARLNRPGAAASKDANVKRKAFEAYVRRGLDGMAPELKTALTVGTDATAGYLAPDTFAPELIKKLVEFSPIRAYARVVTIGSAAVKYPRRLTSTTATWVDETAARTGSNPTYEQIGITPHELATYVDVSTQLLEDNAYNLEGELAADLGEAFGKAEGTAYATGDGNGKPNGLLNASGISEITTGAAAGFPTTNPADVIIGVYHSLPTAHAQRAVWMMNRKTLGTMRKWKDTTGRYLIVDPISEGMPVTLLGRPIVEAIDMPDIAADATPIIFGDMAGYRIVDRIGFAMLRDPYTLATTGQVRFHARKRVGADVTHPDRFVKLTCAA